MVLLFMFSSTGALVTETSLFSAAATASSSSSSSSTSSLLTVPLFSNLDGAVIVSGILYAAQALNVTTFLTFFHMVVLAVDI